MSLDAFRGLTIAGMILVNNPGSWRHIYGPLRHAEWNGWTPTDLVFPFFLFIVGVSLAFAMERRLERGSGHLELLAQALRRSAIIFLLGLFMAGFPNWRLVAPYGLMVMGLSLACHDAPIFSWGSDGSARLRKVAGGLLVIAAIACFIVDFGYFQESRIRVPGVLQRIAVCYCVASLVLLSTRSAGRIAVILLLLVGYELIVAYTAPPAGYTAKVTGESGLLHDWIDVQLLGAHLYSERPDPEGLLSTLPAIATTLLGLVTGSWLRGTRDDRDKLIGMFFVANLLLFAGLWLDAAVPINKKIWSSSYVVLTAGLAMHVLAMCYWLIDVRGWRRWSSPLVVFGTNAIVVFVASSLLAKMLGRWKVADAVGGTRSVKAWLFEEGFASWASPLNASLLFALAYITFWLVMLLPLYRAKVFVRV